MNSALPAWIESEAIQQLLHALVDRLDAAEARGSGFAQSVALSTTLWPIFFTQPFESDREALWEQLRTLAASGLLTLSPERAGRAVDGYALSPRLAVKNVAAVRQAAGRLERTRTYAERWREAVATSLEGDERAKSVARAYCIEIPGRSPEEIVQRLNLLSTFASSDLLLREVSARLFWGMSKVLDHRQPLIAAVLNVDESPFAESPVQLQVVLPGTTPRGVLFVENLHSFEVLSRTATHSLLTDGLTIVYASGFKASAKRLRSRGGASVFYGGGGSMLDAHRHAFEDWLFGEALLPSYFWGDLDWAGMRILRALRDAFGETTAWRPGYAPMLEHAMRGESHEAEAADKVGQAPIAATGCEYADRYLLPSLSAHGFVDQELFRIEPRAGAGIGADGVGAA